MNQVHRHSQPKAWSGWYEPGQVFSTNHVCICLFVSLKLLWLNLRYHIYLICTAGVLFFWLKIKDKTFWIVPHYGNTECATVSLYITTCSCHYKHLGLYHLHCTAPYFLLCNNIIFLSLTKVIIVQVCHSWSVFYTLPGI